MRITLAATAAILAMNCVANAEVLNQSAGARNQIVKGANVSAPAVTDAHPASMSLERTNASSGNHDIRWTWIPSQRGNAAAVQTQIVAIPVPAPGAAALLGLSALLVSRRRAS